MSQPKEQKEKPLPEPEEDEDISFCWGVRKGSINFYESFTLDGIEYSLYDTVYLWRTGQENLDIGKLVKILEMENHEKKVEVVWFFRPTDIHSLGDVRTLEREIFLACGEGQGLLIVNPLEAICGKCNVVCSSKDKRNPQPTDEELEMADHIFHRTFDVGAGKISEEFPSSIAGIEVGHFFNRSSAISSVDSEPKAHSKARSEVEPVKETKNDQTAQVEKGYCSTSSGGQTNGSIKGRTQAGGNMKRSVHFLSVSPSDIDPTKKRKLLPPLGNRIDDALPKPPSKASGEKKHVKDFCRENTDLSTRKSLQVKTSEFTGKGPVSKQHLGPSISYKYSEVTRRPGMDSSKWLKLEVWSEGRLNEANEKGTLVVLENLDPSFTSSEVEDIIWHVFRENVKAKMVQCTVFSSPHSGRALVIFKTKEAAENAISKLISGCLVLGDGRPIVGRRRLPRNVGVAAKFVGHLTIDRTRSHRQRGEIRNAVSTSHFSQANTIEFDMAIQWRTLEEKSHRGWAALHEVQGREIEALMKQMKIHCPE